MPSPPAPSSDDSPGDIDAEAGRWLVLGLDGLSAEEAAERDTWLARDPRHGQRLADLERLWSRLGGLPPDSVARLRPAAPAANGAEPSSRRRWLIGLGLSRPALALAGVATVSAGGGWLAWQHLGAQPLHRQRLVSRRGELLQVGLQDGSRVSLDTQSRAEVRLYRDRRVVLLQEGQAHFVVQPDAERPFDVLAGAARVTVVGTRFSVRLRSGATPRPTPVDVVVEEGEVRVGPQEPSDPATHALAALRLRAGNRVLIDGHGVPGPVGPAPAASPAWLQRRLALDGIPLAEAVAEIERYADTGLVIADPAVAALRLHGSVDLRQVASFVRALPQALPVRLAPRPDGRQELVLQQR